MGEHSTGRDMPGKRETCIKSMDMVASQAKLPIHPASGLWL